MIYERYNLFARVVLARGPPSYLLLSRYKSVEKYTRVKSTAREYGHRARFTAAGSSPNGTLIQHQYGGRTPLFLQRKVLLAGLAGHNVTTVSQTFCSTFIGGLNCQAHSADIRNSFEESASRVARLNEHGNLKFQACKLACNLCFLNSHECFSARTSFRSVILCDHFDGIYRTLRVTFSQRFRYRIQLF